MMLLFLCRSIWLAPAFAVLLHAGPVSSLCAQEAAESIWREVNSLKTSCKHRSCQPMECAGDI